MKEKRKSYAVGIDTDVYRTVDEIAKLRGCTKTEVASDYLRIAFKTVDVEREKAMRQTFRVIDVAVFFGCDTETVRTFLRKKGKKKSDGMTAREVLEFAKTNPKKLESDSTATQNLITLLERYGTHEKKLF